MSDPQPLKITYLTSGAAGMFCGSCMHDNTLAKALIKLGCDVQLVPLYTPIRTDEESIAIDRVFLGGVNVYLQQKFGLFRYLPRWMTSLFDQPWLLRWATSRGMQTSARQLGELTVSILKGDAGFQRKEVERLVSWLDDKPDVIVFSNMLTAGCIPAIKRRLDAKIVVTLQGDDIFLRDLPEPYQSKAFAEIRRLLPQVDGFIVNSHYYADFMAEYLSAPRERFHIIPLGVDTRDFGKEFPQSAISNQQSAIAHAPTVGYLARLAPEKGLHVLVDAFIHLHQQFHQHDVRLRIAGWLGAHNRKYVEQQFQKLRDAGLADKFVHVGEVDRRGKVEFLSSIDVLSVPTTYREPKGLFVLEALAAGVPVIQPHHGAFPELIAQTAGGVLVPPEDPVTLAEKLAEILTDRKRLQSLGQTGQSAVLANFTAERMAERTLAVLREIQEEAREAKSATKS